MTHLRINKLESDKLERRFQGAVAQFPRRFTAVDSPLICGLARRVYDRPSCGKDWVEYAICYARNGILLHYNVRHETRQIGRYS
ncbi:hypothetical protein RHECNPAF_2330046 [Rhizobium etli CNPAF512]|nr:hypothetical protein RHECNPAF_2330046 [Rhizobium etli CNPAF512]